MQDFYEDDGKARLRMGPWRRIAALSRPFYGTLCLLAGAGFLMALADSLLPYVTGRVVDDAVAGGANLGPWAAVYIAAAVSIVVFVWFFIVMAGKAATGIGYQPRAGVDSELYGLADFLTERGHTMYAGETLRTFLLRNLPTDIAGVSLQRLLELHYRYRFAASGLSASERGELRAGVARFIERFREAARAD